MYACESDQPLVIENTDLEGEGSHEEIDEEITLREVVDKIMNKEGDGDIMKATNFSDQWWFSLKFKDLQLEEEYEKEN